MKFQLPISPALLGRWHSDIRFQSAPWPYTHLEGYMQRWFINNVDRGNYFINGPVRRLHHILRSDSERDLHDHPFDYITIILAGGYTEETPVDPAQPAGQRRQEWCAPGSIIMRRAEECHRLILPAGATCTTLFMTSPRRREWGFHTPAGWVDWRSYLGIPPHLDSAGQPINTTAASNEAAP